MNIKDKSGFTLTEVLACLVILGIIGISVAFIFRGTMATSMTQMSEVNDNQVLDAARDYLTEVNKPFTNGYECVTVKELIDYGYISNTYNVDKKIRVTKNMQTRVIEKIEFDDNCN